MPRREAKKAQRTQVATATNAAATATEAAKPGQRHYITFYSVSVSGTTPAVGVFEVRSGSTVKVRLELPAAQMAPIVVDCDSPIECGINEAAIATVTGMGATQTATVGIGTYSVDE